MAKNKKPDELKQTPYPNCENSCSSGQYFKKQECMAVCAYKFHRINDEPLSTFELSNKFKDKNNAIKYNNPFRR